MKTWSYYLIIILVKKSFRPHNYEYLRCLCLFNEFDNLWQHGVSSNMACLHHQCSILVDGSCHHYVPWVLAHWHGLTSDEGFVNSWGTFQHLTIYWNLLSWNNLRKTGRMAVRERGWQWGSKDGSEGARMVVREGGWKWGREDGSEGARMVVRERGW